MRATQDLWEHVWRLKYAHNKEVAATTDHLACESRGIDVSYSFANTTSAG